MDKPGPGPSDAPTYDNEFNYNGDPASVAHLTAEEREEMTQKMMGTFKKELG